MNSPAYLFFSDAKLLPSKTWLIHFTTDAASVARRGFVYGWTDEKTIALTTLYDDKQRKNEPGWNFAFQTAAREVKLSAEGAYSGGLYSERTEGYGREAVLFRSPGVEAFHSGDGYWQVMFWGSSVRCLIPLTRDGEKWVVGKTVGNFGAVLAEAKKHPTKYEQCRSSVRKNPSCVDSWWAR